MPARRLPLRPPRAAQINHFLYYFQLLRNRTCRGRGPVLIFGKYSTQSGKFFSLTPTRFIATKGYTLRTQSNFAYPQLPRPAYYFLEPIGANRSRDLATRTRAPGPSALVANRRSRSTFSLALRPHPGPPRLSVVARSQLFSRIFRPVVLRLRHLGGAGPPAPHPGKARMVRLTADRFRVIRAHRRPVRRGAVPGQSLTHISGRRINPPLPRLEIPESALVPLGLSVSDDSHPRHHLQSDNFSLAVARLPRGRHNSPALLGAYSARRQRHRSAQHGA